MKSDNSTPIEELLEHAPHLQRLAARLARGWDQDDLVQETWLHTLKNPPKNRRNLRGWLTGSLRHRAADHHRREASQRERIDRLAAAKPGDAHHDDAPPPELLARSEALQAVVACLNDLEDPFRHTLLLHYFDGLSVTEIASKLGAPKPTISSRLKRGRERLREMMQTRYGSSAYGICAAAAGPFAPATLAAGSATAAATKSWMPAAGIAAAAVLIGVATIVNLRPEAEFIEKDQGAASSAESPISGVSQPNDTLAAHRLASDHDTEDGRNGVGVEGDNLVRIKGRCVDAVSGMAIPDALVRTHVWQSNNTDLALHGNSAWQAPENTWTNESGEFLIEFEENLSQQISISIEPTAYCPRTARWSMKSDGLLNGTTTDLGDIRFELGDTISGTVVDQNGAPVDGLLISLENLPLPMPGFRSANSSRSGTSDPLGNFTISVPIPPGRYPIEVSNHSGYGSYEDLTLTVGEQGLAGPWKLQVERLQTITGHAIDQYGAPIHHAYITADPEVRTSSKTLSSWTNQSGYFRIYRRHPAGPVRLSVDAKLTDAWQAEGLTEWETHDLTIQLNRRPSLQVLATDTHTGVPIEDFAVEVIEKPSGQSISSSNLRDGGTHEGGLLTIESVPKADYYFSLVPRTRGYVVSNWAHVESTESAEQPVHVELDPLYVYEVVLVDRDGNPVVGSKIEIVDLEGTELNERSRTRRTRLNPWNSRVNSFTGALHLDETLTDEQGYAQVFGYEDKPMALRVTGDHACLLIPTWQPRPHGINNLELEPSGSLRVTLQGNCKWNRPGISLRSVDDPHHRFGFIAFPASNQIEFETLEPGEYDLLWAVDAPFSNANGGGSSGGTSLFEPPLTRIQVIADETAQFEFPAQPLEPARLRGSVRLNGELATSGHLVIQAALRRSEADSLTRNSRAFGAYLVDSNGAFEAGQFPAGELRIRYYSSLSDFDDQLGVECATSVSINPGQLQVQDLEFQIAGVEIQLVHPDGSPAPRHALHVQAPRFGTLPIVTDEQGYYRLDAVPVEGLRVQTIDRREIGTIKPEPGQRWTEVELTLPE